VTDLAATTVSWRAFDGPAHSRRRQARGRRAIFGAPGAEGHGVASGAASCAVPWLFSPVEIEGREYVDWRRSRSPAPTIDARAAGRGTEILGP
jgi:NTE family protein